MKNFFAVIMLLVTPFAYSNPSVFGLTLGQTSEQVLQEKYHATLSGKNNYSHGNMYSIPVDEVNFEGVSEITVIFDKDKKLSAVFVSLPKSQFDYTMKILDKKYKIVRKDIPFVGDKLAIYKNGESEVMLNSPHLSFEALLVYRTNVFINSIHKIKEHEKQQKEKNDEALL
ncbi:hypothetical protein ACWU37_03850 [Photobacterium damselae subsp. damselae]